MAAAEPQDQRSWWQSLDPLVDPRSSATAEGPVPWPDPINLGDDSPPADVGADGPVPTAAGAGEAQPVPLAVDPSTGADEVDEPWDIGGSQNPVAGAGGDDGWSSALLASGPAADPPAVEWEPGPAGAVEIPALYAEHEVPSSPKGWYGAFAGRSTNTVLVGALAVLGVVLLGVLLVVRSGSDPTQSARARPGADTVVTDDDPSPATTSTATTLPAVEPTTSVPVAPGPVPVDQPVVVIPSAATTPRATTPAQSPSPVPSGATPVAPAPAPSEPPPSPELTTPSPPPPVTTTAPPPPVTTTAPPPPVTTTTPPPVVVVTTLPQGTTSIPTPTFTIPTIPSRSLSRPTVPTHPR